MNDFFQKILNEYKIASTQKFANHPMGELLRKTIPDVIKSILPEKGRYIIKGSIGNGQWADTPWVAILDILITNTAQSGYYPVFLFKKDMSGFYLSLNQGVTELRIKYKSETKQVLILKAEDFRAQIGVIPSGFTKDTINLNSKAESNRTNIMLYEAGNIISKYYSRHELPEEIELKNDILEILKVYELISYNEGLPSSQAEKENDEDKYKGYEDLRRFRFHKRIERNIQLSKRVKEAQGYTCKACGMNFVKRYGAIGQNFIEAHHLKPVSLLGSNKIQLDIRTDFTVLCSNCHSMIHRLDDCSDLEKLKALLI